MFEMPIRMPVDGPVSVNRPTEDTLSMAVQHDGKMREIVASRYNAARLLAMLCFMLEVKPPKEIGKLPL